MVFFCHGRVDLHWRRGPVLENEMTRNVHYVGAIGGILLAFVALGIRIWIVSLIFFVIYALLVWLLRTARHVIWWVEWIAILFVITLERVYLLI